MALGWAASASVHDTTGTATTGSLGTTAVGQLIVVTIADDSATSTAVTSVTDNKGNTYTRIGSVLINSVSAQMWYAKLTAAGAGHTVTVAWSQVNASNVCVAAQYFNGFGGTPTLDKTVGTTGVGTSAAPGTTAATSQANEIVVLGAGNDGSSVGFSLGTGYTNLTSVPATGANAGQESKVVSATGTQTGTMTLAASANWGAQIATFYDGSQTVSPTGIATGGAFGSATVSPGPVTVSPTGIASAEAFGTADVQLAPKVVSPTGIASAEAFGTATLSEVATQVSLTGIPSAEAFGTPTVSLPPSTVVLPAGIVPVRVLSTDQILTGDRYTTFRFDLLTRTEAPKGTLTGVESGSVDYTDTATVHGGGTLNVVDQGQNIDWLNDRIRPVILVDGLPEQPLGVFVISEAPQNWSDTGRTWPAKLLDKTAVLDQDCVSATYALDTGTVITTAVATLISSTGEANYSVTPSAATLQSPLAWQPGTSKLKIVNDLLVVAGYFSLYADFNGQIIARPYVAPAARPVQYEFLDGPTSIYSPDFTVDVDNYGVPNVVTVIGQGTGTSIALTATVTNADPKDPHSTVNRGRTVTIVETGVQIADQATLTAHAHKRLIELTQPVSTVTATTAFVPGLNFLNVVRLRRVPAGIDASHVISKIEFAFDPTALVKTTLTQVVNL